MPYIGDDYSMKTNYKELQRRIGKLTITESQLNNEPEFIQAIMAEIIVIRCEYQYHTRSFDYIAFSHLFDICPDGLEPEYYKFIHNEQGIIRVIK